MIKIDGYTKKPVEVRLMTIEEVKQASGHMKVIANDGTVRNVKVNGSPKTWKTRPNDVKVPVKYGLYEYSYVEFVNGECVGVVPVVEVRS